MNKIIICKGCGRKVLDEIDLWDKEKGLCDQCSIKKSSQNIAVQLNLSYIN